METNPPSTTPPPPTEPTPPSFPTQQQTPTPPPPQQQTAATPPPSSTPKSEIPTPSPSLNPNPNPSPSPQIPQSSTLTPVQQQQSQIRPQQPNRTFSQFPSPNIPASSTFAPSSSPATSVQRGGVPALGVPAHQLRPPSQPAPFSNYPQYSGGLSRNPMTMPDSNTSQGKQPIQSVQTIGNFGSLTGSQIRQSGVPIHNQQPRALQGSIRTQSTPTQQSLANQQRFQSHPLLRPTMNSPSSSSSSTPQALQTHTQPWMSGTSQGKQMQPTYRQQTKPQMLQQRIYHPQQHHHPMSSVPHQQVGSSQQQPQQQMPLSHLHQSQEHYGHQYPGGRVQQSISHQQQAQRGIGPGSQKVPMTTMQTTAAVQPSPQNTAGIVDAGESSSHILSKRTIHELVSQIDPSEKLDPEVEDILIEIAEDFVDSITTVGCSLAKHRKSTTLEAKDILLHLERNWHMTLPGFGGDEIKGYKKQLTNDIHKERLAAVKKSMLVGDAVNMKSAQAAGTAKGYAVRAAAPVPGSPKAHGT
ncbi:hypothetical protein ACHQM5_009923 [Ranunculus cassubicifolius]